MRTLRSFTLIASICASIGFLLAPAAQAGFGIKESNFEAGTCVVANCEYSSPHSDFFTQAAGHPPYGITAFEMNSKPVLLGDEPEGSLRRVRVDIPSGLAANPQALPKCSRAAFESDSCPSNTIVGEDQLTVFVAAANVGPLSGTVYDLEQEPGLPLLFGIHVEVPTVANEHIFLEGHVSWAPEPALKARGVPSGDFHEYFEIREISKTIPILKSKLIFDGTAGTGNFLTLPSVCSPSTTSYIEAESYEGQISHTQTQTPVGVDGCKEVPFKPTVQVTPETSQYDQPDGTITEVKVPQNEAAGDVNTADIQNALVQLPEGLTLNPAAANGLKACTPAESGVGSADAVECPKESEIGQVTIETDLPAGTLAGPVYLGGPANPSEKITKPPFTIYVAATSIYGVDVRLQGQAELNRQTGRVEVSFQNNPQLPFSDLIWAASGMCRQLRLILPPSFGHGRRCLWGCVLV